MKKRGNALILTLCVITLLTVLTLILVREATVTYTFTIANEKKDKLSTLAESGIEKGLTALKQKIYNTPEIFTSTKSLVSDEFEFNEDSITTDVSFEDIADYEHMGQAVEITSKAVNSSNNTKKTMSATILKSDISNAYYDAIFNNVISVLDTTVGNKDKSFYMKDNKNPLILDGTMYLQGGEININPNIDSDPKKSFNYISGKINVNANSLVADTTNASLIDKIYVNPTTTLQSSIKGKVKTLSPSLLPILSIKYASPGNAALSNFYLVKSNPNPSYDVNACEQTTITGGVKETTLVTFKVTKKNPANTTSVFDWSTFVTGVKDYIMRNMLGCTNPLINNSYNKYFNDDPRQPLIGKDYEEMYRGMYKLYIIDGDISIKTPKGTGSYINHVVYCTGKCTLGRGDNPYIIFDNSSIMAKQVVVDDLRTNNGRTTNYNNLELHGIKKLNVILGSGQLSPFSAANRASINKFLIQHLDGYADALRFKVYKWKEY